MGGQTGAMRVLVALLLLMACASPDRAFWGSDAQRVQIDGRSYAVYLDRDTARPRVQVIRLGYARRADHPAILVVMVQAAEQVGGCPLVAGSARGDSGVMTARLTC